MKCVANTETRPTSHLSHAHRLRKIAIPASPASLPVRSLYFPTLAGPESRKSPCASTTPSPSAHRLRQHFDIQSHVTNRLARKHFPQALIQPRRHLFTSLRRACLRAAMLNVYGHMRAPSHHPSFLSNCAARFLTKVVCAQAALFQAAARKLLSASCCTQVLCASCSAQVL